MAGPEAVAEDDGADVGRPDGARSLLAPTTLWLPAMGYEPNTPAGVHPSHNQHGGGPD